MVLAAGSRRGRGPAGPSHGHGAIGEAGIGSLGGRVPASTHSLAVSRSTLHSGAVSSSSGRPWGGPILGRERPRAACRSDWHAWAAGDTHCSGNRRRENRSCRQREGRLAGWLVFLSFYFFLEQANCPVVHELPFPRLRFWFMRMRRQRPEWGHLVVFCSECCCYKNPEFPR